MSAKGAAAARIAALRNAQKQQDAQTPVTPLRQAVKPAISPLRENVNLRQQDPQTPVTPLRQAVKPSADGAQARASVRAPVAYGGADGPQKARIAALRDAMGGRMNSGGFTGNLKKDLEEDERKREKRRTDWKRMEAIARAQKSDGKQGGSRLQNLFEEPSSPLPFPGLQDDEMPSRKKEKQPTAKDRFEQSNSEYQRLSAFYEEMAQDAAANGDRKLAKYAQEKYTELRTGLTDAFGAYYSESMRTGNYSNLSLDEATEALQTAQEIYGLSMALGSDQQKTMAERNLTNARNAYDQKLKKENPARYYLENMTEREIAGKVEEVNTKLWELSQKENQWGEYYDQEKIDALALEKQGLQRQKDMYDAALQTIRQRKRESIEAETKDRLATQAKQGDLEAKAKKGRDLWQSDTKNGVVTLPNGNSYEEDFSLAALWKSLRSTVAGKDAAPSFMDEDELEVFFALYAENPYEANQYREIIQKENRAFEFEVFKDTHEDNPIYRAGAHFASIPVKLASGLDPTGEAGQFLSELGETLITTNTEGLNEYGLFNTGALKGETDLSGFMGGILKDSMLDHRSLGDAAAMLQSVETNLLLAELTGGLGNLAQAAGAGGKTLAALTKISEFAGTALMANSARADDYRESLQRGMTEEQAKKHAFWAGVAEGAFEYISLDKLVNPDMTKSFLLRMLEQGLIEGSEEGCTTLANRISDEAQAATSGTTSKLRERQLELIGEGMSPEAARKKAEKEWTADLLYDILGGIASGGLMSAVDSGTRALVYREQNQAIRELRQIAEEGRKAGGSQAKVAAEIETYLRAVEGGEANIYENTVGMARELMQAAGAETQTAVSKEESGTSVRGSGQKVQTAEASGRELPSSALESIETTARQNAAEQGANMSEAEIRETVEALQAMIDESESDEFTAQAKGQIAGLQEALQQKRIARGDDLGLAEGLGRVGLEAETTDSSASLRSAQNDNEADGGRPLTAPTGEGGQVARATAEGGLNSGRIQGGSEIGGDGRITGPAAEQSAADGGQRDAGLGADRQAGGLGEGTVRSESRSQRAQELAQLRNYVQTLEHERKSSRELGVWDGTKNSANVLIEEEGLTDELRRVRQRAEDQGVRVDFVTGQIETRIGGKIRKAAGVFQIDRDGRPHVFIQADSKVRSPQQIMDHELFHAVVSRNKGLWQDILDYLYSSHTEEEVSRMVEAYVDAYDGCYGTEDADTEKYLEEIFADVYAEMQRGGGQQRAAREMAGETAQRFAGDIENARQNLEGIDRRNGPGTRLSPQGNKKSTKQSATSPLSGRPSSQKGSIGTDNQVTAAAELLGVDNISQQSDSVKDAIVKLAEFSRAVKENRAAFGSSKAVTADNLTGLFVKTGVLTRGSGSSAYRTDNGHTLRVSNHSANSAFFNTSDNLSIVLQSSGPHNTFYDAPGKNVVEAVYSKRYLNENPNALQALIADLGNYIATGKFRDSVPGRNYNLSGNTSGILVNGKTWQQMNNEYLDAVKQKDMETAQRMVDEAAKRAGFTIKAYHGTRSGEFYVFDKSRTGQNYGGYNASGGGFDFTTNERFANLWGRKAHGDGEVRVMPVYLKAEKTFYAYRAVAPELADALPENLQIMDQETGEVFTGEEAVERAMRRGADFQDALEENGIDFVSVLQDHGFDSYAMHEDDENIAVYNEDQIKSAEPVTRDDNGNVIPLSERFRTDRTGKEAWKNRDIRFSPSEEEEGVDWIGGREDTDSSPLKQSESFRAAQNDNEENGGRQTTASTEANPSTGRAGPPPLDMGDFAEQAREKKTAAAEKASVDGLKSRIKSAEERLRMLKTMESSGLMARDAKTRAEYRQQVADVEQTIEIYREALQKKQAARKAEQNDEQKKAERRTRKKQEKAALRKEAELEADKPRQARKEFRQDALNLFSVPAAKRQALGKILNDFSDRLLRQGSVSQADRRALFTELYEAGVEVARADEYYRDIREFVKSGRIYVPQDVRAEFGDDWESFRKRAWGNGIYLTNSQNDRGVDAWNQELAEVFQGSFDAENLDAKGMLENIVDLAEEGKSEYLSIGEMMARNQTETGVTVDEQMDELERKVDRLIDTFAQKAELERQVRTEGVMKLAKERKKNREIAARQVRQRQENQTRSEVMKQLQQLNKMRKKSDPEIRAKIDEIIGNLDTMARSISPAGMEDLQALARRYAEAKDDPNFLGNPYVEQRLARLSQVQLDDLDISEVIELGRTISALVKSVTENKRLLTDARNREISAAARDVDREIKGSSGSKGGKIRDFFGKEHLSPTRMLQMIGGWVRGGQMEQLSNALEEGGTKRLEYMRQATRIFDKFTADKENQKWLRKAQGKDAEWISVTVPVGITDEGGRTTIRNQTFEITPMMRVGLLMHSRNVDNLRHIETGGIVIPNKEWYRKGNLAEADAKGTRIKMRPETVRAIVKDCTAQERAFASLLEQYYDGYSKDRINEVSMLIDGFERAGGDHYYGIKVSRKFLATQPEQVQRNMSLESIGSIVNERVHAGNPIILEDASTALTDHIDLISKYYGFTAPIRDFNAVMNYTFHEAAEGDKAANADAGSIKETLQDKWGSGAQKYMDKLLADLQQPSGVTDTVAQFMSKLRGNLAGASLMVNPAVAFSQFASYPGAMQSLGPAALAAGLKPGKVDMQLIEKYTPVLWYRNQGNSTQELGDYLKAKGFEGKLPWLMGWIQKIDSFTIRRLWAAAEYKVAHETDLSPGSQAEIDAGTDPFYQEVARWMNRAVYDTQPNYTEMQRPGVLRSESDLTKAMTMYKTVPLQYYNMMFEAAGRLRADAARYKANATAENKAQLAQSRRFAAMSYVGVLTANVVYVAMKALVKGLTGRGKKYKDEEGEFSWKAALPALGKDLLETYAGSLIFGGDLLTAAEKLIEAATTGSYSRYGGMEISMLSAIEDTRGSIYNLAARLHKEDYRGGLGAVKDLAKQLAMDFGFPANNIETYLLGITKWIAPEWADRYENLFGEYVRADLNGKRGRELNAAIRVLMDNRTDGLKDGTIDELQRLYEAGMTAQLPSAVPSKITVDGEEIALRWKEREQYRETWGRVVGEGLEELMRSDAYEAADDEDKAKLIKKLYDYAAQIAAGETTGKGSDAWVAFGQACQSAGISLVDYLGALVASKDSMKKLDGAELDAAVRARMQFRAGDLKDETVDELGRLYVQGQSAVIPGDVPASFSVSGEEVKLTPEQRVEWLRAWKRTAGENLEGLIASDAYQKASDEERARMISALYDVARAGACSEISESYSPDKWIRVGFEAADRGVDINDYVLYHRAVADAKTADALDTLMKQSWTDAQKAFIWEGTMASEAQMRRYKALHDAGTSWKDAMEIMGVGDTAASSMTQEEQEKYQAAWDQIAGLATQKLLKNPAYQKADKAAQSAYVDRLNDWVTQVAKGQVLKEYEKQKWVVEGERLQEAGVGLDEFIVFYSGISDAKSKDKYAALNKTGWTESQQLIAMEYISASTYNAAKVGRSYQVPLRYYLGGLAQADTDQSGGISQAEAEAYLNKTDLGREDKAYLWQMLCSSSKWKNNPYNTAWGEEIWHSLHPEG